LTGRNPEGSLQPAGLAPLMKRLLLAQVLLAATGFCRTRATAPRTAPGRRLLTRGLDLARPITLVRHRRYRYPESNPWRAHQRITSSAAVQKSFQKNSNRLGDRRYAPSNLSNSRIGLQGNERIVGDWSGVFPARKPSSIRNPGQIARWPWKSGCGRRTNGRSFGTQNTNVDSKPAIGSDGSSSPLMAGFRLKDPSVPFTLRRQKNTVACDGIAKYGPELRIPGIFVHRAIARAVPPGAGGDTQESAVSIRSGEVLWGAFQARQEGWGLTCRRSTTFNQSTGQRPIPGLTGRLSFFLSGGD